ncbi:MAG: LysR family transcriptional regulator [Actinobacteria bacterium]|nr:LysR family transcriptional regulator [Actinomycetota bacterium]
MRRKIPSLQALLCFDAAARHESYTRAADELVLTQSAVSRQVNQLEDFLGLKLFRRTRHGVALTPAGADYAQQVGQRLAGLERDTLDTMSRQGSGGHLTLAAVPTFATHWLIPRLRDLAHTHPDITVHIDTRTRPFLFADTIAYNLRFAAPQATDVELHAAVRSLELDDWVASLSEGLHTQVGQRGAALAAGERQMVALLRASLVNPDVLILDEATSSVDALTEVRIARALRKLSAGRTTISIAHRLSTAARADRVVLLANGQILEDGSHEALMAHGGEYKRMYDAWLTATRA